MNLLSINRNKKDLIIDENRFFLFNTFNNINLLILLLLKLLCKEILSLIISNLFFKVIF